MNNPQLIATPFAENGDKNIIPESIPLEPQNATLEKGFPLITQQPINEGGIPPERQDFNGALNLITQHTVFLNKGGRYGFDAEFANKIGGYEKGACLTLNDGTQVVSDIDANTNDPNVNMTGWVFPPIKVNASSVLDEGGLTQQEVNNLSKNIFYPLSRYYTESEIEADFTLCLTNHIAYVDSLGGGSIIIDDGFYEVDISKGIPLKSNIQLILGINTHIKAKPTRVVGGSMFNAKDTFNVSISGGILDGNRDAMLAPDNKPWNQFKENTTYTTGQYVWIGRWGCIVTVAGTTGNTTPVLSIVPTIGGTVTSGTVTFKCVEDVGEWGFGIDLRGANKFHVSNCEINNWWGDAIYVGRSNLKAYSEDILLENVNIDNCRRQGVSVITVKGFVWRKGKVTNINGAAPMAGIDLEPNYADEFMKDVILEDVHVRNCSGNGFHVYLVPLNSTTTPDSERFSLTMRDCSSKDNSTSFFISGLSNPLYKGYAHIENCQFLESFGAENATPTLRFESNHPDGIKWDFYNCKFRRNSTGKQAIIRSEVLSPNVHGGLHMYNCSFEQMNKDGNYDAMLMMNKASGSQIYRDITISNPYVCDFTQNAVQLNAPCLNLVLRDDHNVMTNTLASNGSLGVNRFLSSLDLNGKTLTLQTPTQGQDFVFKNSSTTAAIIKSNYLIGFSGAEDISIPKNGEIRARWTSDSLWLIYHHSQNVRLNTKLAFSIASQVIAPNSSVSLPFDFPGASSGDSFIINFNQILLGLGLVGQVFSQGSSKVNIVIRNLNSTETTLPQTTAIIQRV